MDIAVIGTGFIGGILGKSLARAGHQITFGSRHPGDADVAVGSSATVDSVAAALASADVIVLAIPGSAVSELTAANKDALMGKLVIDATNRMGEPVANSRAPYPRMSDMPGHSIRWAARTWPTRSSMMVRPTCSSLLSNPTEKRLKQSSKTLACARFTLGRTKRRSSIASSVYG